MRVAGLVAMALATGSGLAQAGPRRDPELRKLTCSDEKVLPFKDADFLLGSSAWDKHWRLDFQGPVTQETDLTKPLPWRLRIVLWKDEEEKVVAVSPPENPDSMHSESRRGQAVVYIAETAKDQAPDMTTKPSWWACEGAITFQSLETFEIEGSKIPRVRFEAALEIQVQAVDRKGAKPELKGPKVKLTGAIKVDTSK